MSSASFCSISVETHQSLELRLKVYNNNNNNHNNNNNNNIIIIRVGCGGDNIGHDRSLADECELNGASIIGREHGRTRRKTCYSLHLDCPGFEPGSNHSSYGSALFLSKPGLILPVPNLHAMKAYQVSARIEVRLHF
jgi:hypothetical protein